VVDILVIKCRISNQRVQKGAIMENMEDKTSKFLDTRELAARWKISPRTLENQRGKGQGPEFFKIGGKVLYDIDYIEEYEKGRLVHNGAR
jgi:hypothetical protein